MLLLTLTLLYDLCQQLMCPIMSHRTLHPWQCIKPENLLGMGRHLLLTVFALGRCWIRLLLAWGQIHLHRLLQWESQLLKCLQVGDFTMIEGEELFGLGDHGF